MKKLVSIVLALALVALCIGAAVADNETYTITLTNADQNVVHSYKAYQVFAGNLSSDGKLTDITWGNGVNGGALYSALLADSSPIKTALAAKNIAEADQSGAKGAQALAEVIAGQNGTQAATALAGDLDKIASIIAANKATGTALTAGDKTYTATVAPGYYIVIDESTNLINSETSASDTLAKSMLTVVQDVTIVAKDTGLTPDKKIRKDAGLETETKVAADSAALGDTVYFEVTIQVPDTRKYIKDFVFTMDDQLPVGLTYKAPVTIKIDGTDFTSFTTTVKTGTADYSAPSDGDYVNATGGQKIHVTFVDFKQYVDANPGKIGKTIAIRYAAVVNKNADFTETGNENEVKFDYSNNPDHEYDGDEFDDDEPHGTTPEKKTKTFVTQLKIKKVDGSNQPLEGAEFSIVADPQYTVVMKTSEEFIPWTEDATNTYWKLKNDTYTTTDPSTLSNTSMYVDTSVKYQKVTRTAYIETPTTPTTISAVSNASGIIEVKGLNEGTYTITETAAPQGYNKIDKSYKIKVRFNTTDNKFEIVAADSDSDFSYNETDDIFEITIQNQSGTTLPSTGGIGTTIFYILGGLLVVGAAVILVARRKASN